METIQAIKKRRSIRHFDTSFRIPQEEINQLIELAMLAPTSYNIQHWKFLVVEDLELRKEIQKASFNQSQITEASHLILICSDTKAWEKHMEYKWQNTPNEIQKFMVESTHNFYSKNEQLQHDEAIRSASFATQNLIISATSMGYDSSVMVGFEYHKVAKLVNLPNDMLISNFVVLGKGNKAPYPRGGQLVLSDVLIRNIF